MADIKQLPAWRRGWTWTLIKCATTTLALALAGAFALLALLRAHLLGPPSRLAAGRMGALAVRMDAATCMVHRPGCRRTARLACSRRRPSWLSDAKRGKLHADLR